MTLTERIDAFIKYEKINRATFERKGGLSNGYVNNIKGNIGSKKLEQILTAFPNLNRVWLLTGTGDMLISSKHSEGNAQLLGVASPAIAEDTVPVRFFEPHPSASFREFCAGMNENPDVINILPEPGDNITEQSCVFTVTGDSMAPQIQDKAKVLCEEISPSRWFSLFQGVIVIVYDDRFVIKRIRKNCLDTKNYILLCSDNPEYPEMEKAYLGAIRSVFKVNRVISQKVY